MKVIHKEVPLSTDLNKEEKHHNLKVKMMLIIMLIEPAAQLDQESDLSEIFQDKLFKLINDKLKFS